MSQQIQELINKIKAEGIEEAQKKAKAIETQAQENAKELLAKTKRDSERLMSEADSEIKKKQEAAENAIKQAARDTLLGVRQEIERILERIVLNNVSEALTVEQLFELISQIIEKSFTAASNGANIQVMLNPGDLERLNKGFLAKLKDRVKEGIEFKPVEDIGKGFVISFDKGKSAFDFSDAALAEYLSTQLHPEIVKLIKDEKTR